MSAVRAPDSLFNAVLSSVLLGLGSVIQTRKSPDVEDLDPSQGTNLGIPPFPKGSPVSIFINPPKGSVGAGSPSYIRVTPLTKV